MSAPFTAAEIAKLREGANPVPEFGADYAIVIDRLLATLAVFEAFARKVDDIACRATSGSYDDPPEPVNPDGQELAYLARDVLGLPR